MRVCVTVAMTAQCHLIYGDHPGDQSVDLCCLPPCVRLAGSKAQLGLRRSSCSERQERHGQARSVQRLLLNFLRRAPSRRHDTNYRMSWAFFFVSPFFLFLNPLLVGGWVATDEKRKPSRAISSSAFKSERRHIISLAIPFFPPALSSFDKHSHGVSCG